MHSNELDQIIKTGEDSQHQFKEMITRSESLAAEMIAFSNSIGGVIFVGVADNGEITGLTSDQVAILNQLIANTATNNIRPAINVKTENINHSAGVIVAIKVEKGLRPCTDNQGVIWVKNGSDKRRVTAIEEMQRMFQDRSLVHADETLVNNSTINDLDLVYFNTFYEKVVAEPLLESPTEQLLENMNLMRNGQFNICGGLLLMQKPQFKLPTFIVKAITFAGDNITDQTYLESQDIAGKFAEVYQASLNFVMRNIRHIQGDQSFNSVGFPEISKVVFEEIIANAMIHRDYFVMDTIKLLIFNNRIEIISPGHLPNNLTVENIKLGNSNTRNPIISSFAKYVVTYRGIGSGIRRALSEHQNIEFIDDRVLNQFKVVIWRNENASYTNGKNF